MKRIIPFGAVAVIVAGLLVIPLAHHRADAEPTTPPDHMSALDAAQLDAAMLHLDQLAQSARPYQETVKRICANYQIEPAQLGKTVGIDLATGAITRKPAVRP